MIPRANITAWRVHAPWPSNEQVEQDLVLSRALIAMFSRDLVAEQAVFRGGTVLLRENPIWLEIIELFVMC